MLAPGVANTHQRPHHRRAAVIISGAVVAISALGGLGVDTNSAWYRDLELPSWQPPGAAFGPVWTVLYALLARSAYLAWRDVQGSRRTPILGLYVLNGALNLAWTILFFRAHSPVIAGVEILLLLATILALIVLMRPVSRQASWALVPYALWVAFAAALTWAIAASN
ncbi:MAG: TspO/MBR family protein [Syntrophothermus sp.]